MPDISIAISASDRYSSTLKTMTQVTKAFDKESEELEKTLNNLSAEKSVLKAQTDAARKTMAEAQKQFAKTGDAADAFKAALAGQQYEGFRRNLDAVNQTMKETEKQIQKNEGAIRKFENRVSGGGISDVAKMVAATGIGNAIGGLATNAANTWFGSILGDEGGAIANSAINSAISTAVAGFAVSGPIGAVAGGIAGGLIGGASGALANGTKRDDAFKRYVQEAAENQLAQRDSDIESGSGIYAERESDLRVFTTLLGDDADAAKRFQSSLIEIGRTPPFSYGTVAALSKDMLGLGLSTDDATKRINSLAEASAALDWSESNVSSVISLLESAQLAGQFDSRIVKSLSKMGVNAYEALAKEFEISQDEVMDQLSNLDVNRAVQAIYDYMGKRFSGAAAGLEGTYSGASGILASYEEDMQSAYGEGYNEARNKGLLDQIDWLSGTGGDAQKEANRAIGAWQASLENAKEEYIRKAVDDAMETGDYQKAKAAGDAAEMGRILMQAKVKGMNEYNASNEAQEALAAEKALVDGIRADTAMNEDYWDAGYERGQWYSKGVAAGIADGIELAKKATAIRDAWEAFGGGGNNSYFDTDPGSFAVGLNRVPYDNFPALLHEGERVLTASQARAEERGGPTVQVTVTGNSFYGSDAAMEDRVAQKVAREVARAVQLGV